MEALKLLNIGNEFKNEFQFGWTNSVVLMEEYSKVKLYATLINQVGYDGKIYNTTFYVNKCANENLTKDERRKYEGFLNANHSKIRVKK